MNSQPELSSDFKVEIFILDDELSRLEHAVPAETLVQKLNRSCALAWHLRERDTARSLDLVEQAQRLSIEVEINERSRLRLNARLQLTVAEIKWLYSELDTAQKLAHGALIDFRTLDDHAGCSDAHWILAAIASDDDSYANADNELSHAIDCAKRCGDMLRVGVAQGMSAFRLSHRSPSEAKERWGKLYPDDTKMLHPAIATWVDTFWASFYMQAGDFGTAALCCIQAYEKAMASGQIRRAINSAANAAECLSNLKDHESAFEWMHRGVDLARSKAWPVCVGAALSRLGELLCQQGQLDAAQGLLYESIEALRPCKASRSYFNVLFALGCLENDCKRHDIALEFFKQLADLADAHQQSEFQISARTGQASALAQMGQREEALVLAGTALNLARKKKDPFEEINALKVLAKLNLRDGVVDSLSEDDVDSTLYFLKQEIEVASNIEGYLIEGGLYEAVAREYAKSGDFKKAYEYTLKASAAHAQTSKKEVANRAIAMQIKHQAERAYEEAKHFKTLAAVEAERAQTLQQTSQTLERLSAIGQEITAHINEYAVFHALDRHVHAMLDAQAMGIWLLEGDVLRHHFGVEDGQTLGPEDIPLDMPHSNAVRCIKEMREIHVQFTEGVYNPTHIDGTRLMLSCLFAPLSIGDTVLGVLSIQSTRANAYGERELQIFRTLLAYGSIALANAASAKKLAEAQIELERQKMTTVLVHAGKMMAVGKLASGVVHEISHPVGSISMLTEAVQTLRSMNRVDEALDVTQKIGREVNRLRSLILRLRRFSRLDPPEVKAIGLQAVIDDARQLFVHQLELDKVDYHESIEPVSVLVDSERLSLAIANIVCNACDAMAEHSNKHVIVNARTDQNRLRLSIRDTGPGLPAEVLNRVFEPFFTTKSDGLGLGLAISMESIVSMNGSIEVANHPEGGAEFTLVVPLEEVGRLESEALRIEVC